MGGLKWLARFVGASLLGSLGVIAASPGVALAGDPPGFVVLETQAFQGGSDESADLNDAPIRVWVYRDPSTQRILAVREVGHANEQVCAKVSLALRDFMLAAAPSPNSFLTFGAGSFEPGADDAKFQLAANSLVTTLTPLAKSDPWWFELHDVNGAPAADRVVAPAAVGRFSRLAVRERLDIDRGPAFFTLKSWDPAQPNGPFADVSWSVVPADLGLTPGVLDRLGLAADFSPIVSVIKALRSSISDAKSARSALQQTRNKWPKATVTKSLKIGGVPAPIDASYLPSVQEATRQLQWALAVAPVILASSAIRDLDAAIKSNKACADRLAAGGTCQHFIDVRFGPAPPDADMQLEILNSYIAQQQSDVNALATRLRALQAQSVPSAVIDALLRGWPFSTESEADAKTLDAILRNSIPGTWSKIAASLRARQINMATPGTVGGVLARTNVLFRIVSSGAGYNVYPLFVASGPYELVFDSNRHLVTVETPTELP